MNLILLALSHCLCQFMIFTRANMYTFRCAIKRYSTTGYIQGGIFAVAESIKSALLSVQVRIAFPTKIQAGKTATVDSIPKMPNSKGLTASILSCVMFWLFEILQFLGYLNIITYTTRTEFGGSEWTCVPLADAINIQRLVRLLMPFGATWFMHVYGIKLRSMLILLKINNTH